MKRIEIFGENYCGQWKDSRSACRAVIEKNGKILLSYESKTGQWMIPGGGLEPGETETDCCRREVAEETGVRISPSECFLEIDEYYEEHKWVNKYYLCEVTGEAAIHLTAEEKAVGLEPRWVDVKESTAIFSTYRSFAGKNEMRRGLYFREYTALCALHDDS